ncbi:MAG: acyltransferase family protein [Acidimicrobiales bacterium]
MAYRPALDGLRALAVIAVFAYHADLREAPAGFLGVDLFFVLSGYLITALLLTEHQRCGRVDLVKFWKARARRLLPALVAVLAAVAVVTPALAPEQIGRLGGDMAAALTYSSNWWMVVVDQSYFESTGRPPLLQHLWSLAVEEQFYLVWPLMLGAILAAGRRRAGRSRAARTHLGRRGASGADMADGAGTRIGGAGIAEVGSPWSGASFPEASGQGTRRRLLAGLLLAAGASGLAMAAMYDPSGDPSRVYYGTDTRASALLIGAALAVATLAWHRPQAAAPRFARSLTAGGGAALCALAWAVINVSEFDPRLYRGGLVLAGLVAATAVAAAAAPGRPGLLIRVLGMRPLLWVGRRSYGIYLWSWPVLRLTRPHLDVPLAGMPLLALQVVLTGALAAASYRWVEMPIRSAWRPGRPRVGGDRATSFPAAPDSAMLLGEKVVLVPRTGPDRTVVESMPEPKTVNKPRRDPDATTGSDGARVGDARNVLRPRLGVLVVTAASMLVGVVAWIPITARPIDAGSTGRPPQPRQTTAVTLILPDGAIVGPVLGADSASVPISESQPGTPGPADGVQPPTSPTPPTPLTGAPAPVAAGTVATPPAPTGRVTVVADSVILGAQAELASRLGDLVVDARIGRQFDELLATVSARVQQGQVGDVLVLQMGNNGPVRAEQVNALLDAAGSIPRLVVVNVKVERRWADPNNEVIAAAVAARPNARLVDWKGIGSAHPGAFTNDGIHLTPSGRKLMADAIVAALAA